MTYLVMSLSRCDMSALTATLEQIEAAATDLAAIGSSVNAAHLAATAPTVSVLPAAADEVSAGIAHLFSQHAAGYQALAGQAAAFQQSFVQHLTASAGSFAGAEAANTALLQPSTAIAGAVAGASTGLQDLLGKLIVQLQNSFWNALFSLPYPIQAALGVGLALIILALLPVFALINSVFGTRILEGFWI